MHIGRPWHANGQVATSGSLICKQQPQGQWHWGSPEAATSAAVPQMASTEPQKKARPGVRLGTSLHACRGAAARTDG